MIDKPAQTAVPVADVIAKRWSGVAFDPERDVSAKELTALFEAARWAPSCYGDQPWRFVAWRRFADGEQWQRALVCLSESNQAWARHAAVLILAAADMRFEHNGKSNRWGAYDTGAASLSLCLQAAALGIMTHQMGGFDAERMRSEFAIPERFQCMAVIAAGYQLAEKCIPESLKEREFRERRRRELEETVYWGKWATAK